MQTSLCISINDGIVSNDRIVSIVNQAMKSVVHTNASLTAPCQVPVDAIHDKDPTDPSPSKPPIGVGRGAARVERVSGSMSLFPSHVCELSY